MTTSFEKLGLIEPLLHALHNQKYEKPTPIQVKAIPSLLLGKDLLGCAQTGTGKTAAFTLPILQHLAGEKHHGRNKSPRALIITPTRELAAQIGVNIRAYSCNLKISHTVIYGGVSIVKHVQALSRNIDIVVATPGRLLDLMRQRLISLNMVKFLTLDEADRMLDMGFIHDIKKIIAEVPKDRQSLFFSATMPKNALQLADSLLNNPVKVTVNPPASTCPKVKQKVFFVNRTDKDSLLLSLLDDVAIDRALIFTKTKHRANKVTKKLLQHNVKTEVIHGNKSQAARTKAIQNFSDGKARVLVATDIASRGIDIKGVTHVINFEMPTEAENYVHRIGRTARAGAEGIAISFCDSEEKSILRSIERITNLKIAIDNNHPYHSEQAASHRDDKKIARHTARRGKTISAKPVKRFGKRPTQNSGRRPAKQRQRA